MALVSEDLDEAQREAVFCPAPYILVAAPPGSGKTRVLAARFARLIGEGMAPGAVIALTFTGKAAMEMAERVSTATSRDISNAFIGTFHALCLRILKKHRPALEVYGRAGQIEALRNLGVKAPQKAADFISLIKNRGAGEAELSPEFLSIYERYEVYLREHGALDLDDLISGATLLLEAEGVEGALGSPCLDVLVDEYQDINAPQARLLRALAGKRGHVFAIGDVDQAIYSFRGASLGFFMSFKEKWPGAVVMNLRSNYRSASAIVSTSQSLVGHNKERLALTPVAVRGGGAVTMVTCADETAISRYILKEIESRMGGLTSLASGKSSGDGTTSFSDFAVLFRTRASARRLIEAFSAGNLPYHLAGPSSDAGQGLEDFFRRMRGTCIGDGVSLINLVKKEVKAVGLVAGLSELVLWLASRYGEKEAAPCIEDFIGEARAFAEGIEPTVVETDKVNLMTLHGAKGLEFKIVFIVGVEEGLIPLCREGTSLEEERRLFYVGLTRAADEVVLLAAIQRRLYGKLEQREVSPFVAELGDGIKKITPSAPKKRRRRAVQKGLFE